MNSELKAMVDGFGGKIKGDDPEDAFKSRDGAGMTVKGYTQAVVLELPDECVAVFYSAITGEIRFQAGIIRFIYKTEDDEGVWVYHTVTITGGTELRQVFRDLAAGKRESIRVTGQAVTAIAVESDS